MPIELMFDQNIKHKPHVWTVFSTHSPSHSVPSQNGTMYQIMDLATCEDNLLDPT